MWNDIETTKDFLNYRILANTAAQMIQDSQGQPLSIGISGSWGSGKSSLVKMIGASLKENDKESKYVFLEFNAWLYQGFDDARMALLQSVADKMQKEADSRKTAVDKVKEFVKRINWLRLGKLLAPVATSAIVGGSIAGPIGGIIGAVGSFVSNIEALKQEDFDNLKSSYEQLTPELTGLLKDKKTTSMPQEIEELRSTFQNALEEMGITLIVLVDDLDRCLPPTAISTLEAMRLLLFLPHTAFIIAADEQMIRSAVRTHFASTDISSDLATSYFDKLIQVPLRIPHLGINEIKCYLVLLLAEKQFKKDKISLSALTAGESAVLELVKQSWLHGLTKKNLEDAFKGCIENMRPEIELADQIAPILVTAEHISGNPRLIKRFLNNLEIREAIAKAHGISVNYDMLVKIQLFERCVASAGFDFLVKTVAESPDGKPKCIIEAEEALSKGEDYAMPNTSWDTPFVKKWLKLSPPLSNVDLRPLLYLSHTQTMSLATYDELSEEGRALLEAILATKDTTVPLIAQLKLLPESENDGIMHRILRRAKAEQWPTSMLIQCLHTVKAYPNLGSAYANYLKDMPATIDVLMLIPHLRDEPWAKDLLNKWAATLPAAKKALEMRMGGK